MMRWAAAATMAILSAILLATPLSAQDAEDSWAGRWLLTQSNEAAQARRDAAIDAATREMHMVARRVARRRLHQNMSTPQKVTIEGEAATFRAHVGEHILAFAADGTAHAMTGPSGNRVQASQRLEARRLRQVIRHGNATLTHDLRLSDDGQEIRLSIRIASPRLPADVVYRLTFRRG